MDMFLQAIQNLPPPTTGHGPGPALPFQDGLGLTAGPARPPELSPGFVGPKTTCQGES